MAIDGERIAAIYIVRNPDKLRRLPPAAALRPKSIGSIASRPRAAH
jgi:hypothetical protein